MTGVEFKVDAKQFSQMLGKSSALEVNLRTKLRKAIRESGMRVADDARRRVGNGPLRDQIAAGIKVSISTTTNGGSVTIRSTGPLAAAWQSEKGWRHPVFGNRDNWAQQKGSPGYFWKAVHEGAPSVRRAVEAAMREAVDSL